MIGRRTRGTTTPPASPSRLHRFPEALLGSSGFVGVANTIEVLGEEQADLGERLEHRSLAVEEWEAHARQLLPAALEQGVHGGEVRVEVLSLFHRPLDDGRDQAVDRLAGARGALCGRVCPGAPAAAPRA